METLESYTNHLKHSGYRWNKGTSIMPREKWDTVEQYVGYLRHLAEYMFMERFIDGSSVLEIGSGTGFGANYLSKFASSIIASDIWEEGIVRCPGKYRKDNLIFIVADGTRLPFKADSFDVVMSFHVIEHIEPKSVLDYLSDIKKVLKRGGVFIVSTPNSRIRLLPFEKPWDPNHKKEYKDDELRKLLSKVFEQVTIYGLCESQEVQALKNHRVKHSPFKAYILRPLYRALNDYLPAPILTWLKRIKRHLARNQTGCKPMSQEAFVSKFSVNDFRLDPTCPKDCRDLYGICAKIKS